MLAPSSTSLDAQILAEAQSFAAAIAKIYTAADYDITYKLSVWWGTHNRPVMDDALWRSEDASEAIRKIAGTHLYNIQREGPQLARSIEWHRRALAARGVDLGALLSSVEESSFIPSGQVLEWNGRLVSNELVRNIYLSRLLDRHIPAQTPIRIFELGAGMGHLARVVCLARKVSQYVVIDIPETLVFSYMFLRLHFPEARCILLGDEASIQRYRNETFDFVFCPTMHADLVGATPYDLFLNTASLGEMPNEVIRHWMNFVQEKCEPKYILSVNRYLNAIYTELHKSRLAENEATLLYDHRWDILSWELDPFYYRSPYACSSARYAEILAKRLPASDAKVSSAARRAACRKHIEDLVLQEWLVLAGEMKSMLRDNTASHAFVIDTSMDGTIFKLWDAVRIEKSVTTSMLMLLYLDFVRDYSVDEFEETSCYEEELRKLLDPTTELGRKLEAWLAEKAVRRVNVQQVFAQTRQAGGFLLQTVTDLIEERLTG